MKVAVVTPFFPLSGDPHGGQATVQILCALRQRAEVQVFCPIPAYPRGLRSRSYSEADPDYQVPPLTVTYIRYPSLPVLSRPFNGAICARYLEPHLRAYAPDVVLNYWIYPQGRGALLAARRLGAAVVVGAIGSDLNALPDPVSAHLARRTMLEADHVITKSAKLRELALTMGVPAAAGRRAQSATGLCWRWTRGRMVEALPGRQPWMDAAALEHRCRRCGAVAACERRAGFAQLRRGMPQRRARSPGLRAAGGGQRGGRHPRDCE
jgi:hypothetical protein